MSASILAEVHNLYLFFEAIVLAGVFTGLALVPFILLGYELATKRRA